MSKSILVLLFLISIISSSFAWPPNPTPTPPQVGLDIPGSDLGGMPITLSSPDYKLCASMCDETPNCRAWAYGLPNCGGSSQPLSQRIGNRRTTMTLCIQLSCSGIQLPI